MRRHEELGFAIVIFCLNSINFVSAKCPSPSFSSCNCSDTKDPARIVVSCDGLASVPDLKWQLDGLPAGEISELAILRTKNFNGIRPDFFDLFKILKRLSLAANPLSNLKLPIGLFSKIGATLEALDLSTSNQTEKDLPPGLFEPLVNLKVSIRNTFGSYDSYDLAKLAESAVESRNFYLMSEDHRTPYCQVSRLWFENIDFSA